MAERSRVRGESYQVSVKWNDVHLQPAGAAKFGYLHVHDGKSRYWRRNVSLTARVLALLEGRNAQAKSPWVFTSEHGTQPLSVFTVDCQHAKVRALLNEHLTKNGMPAFPRDFIIHPLRHTMLSRLGEAGADAFTVMRIAGHSTVVVSQRYVHPSPESLERAFERLEAANQKAVAKLPQGGKVLLLPTNLPTLPAGGEAAVS